MIHPLKEHRCIYKLIQFPPSDGLNCECPLVLLVMAVWESLYSLDLHNSA